MKIYRPVKNDNITQKFGEDKACVKGDSYISKKTDEKCPNGYQSLYEKVGMEGHNGFDFDHPDMAGVFHCANWDGWVQTEVDKHGGIGVEVISNEEYDGSYWKLKYWHLDSYGDKIYDGRKVSTGDFLAYGDNTGQSTGTHLHLGLKRCDANGNPTNLDNGYYGGVDIEPYYVDEFVGVAYELNEDDLTVFKALKKFGLLKFWPAYLNYKRRNFHKGR